MGSYYDNLLNTFCQQWSWFYYDPCVSTPAINNYERYRGCPVKQNVIQSDMEWQCDTECNTHSDSNACHDIQYGTKCNTVACDVMTHNVMTHNVMTQSVTH